MKVVITGGEGFIGNALAAALTKRGAEIIIVDRKKGIEAEKDTHLLRKVFKFK